MGILRVILIGDVVGDPGLEVLENRLPHLIKEFSADFVTVNGENAAGGFGLMDPQLRRILAAGADVVTSGNHIWEKREIWPILDSEKRLVRPLNYPAGSPGQKTVGRGWVKLEKQSPGAELPVSWVVVNLQGREFMTPLDCPFRTFDVFEANLGEPSAAQAAQSTTQTEPDPFPVSNETTPEHVQRKPIILVDFHAESTREKETLAYYLDGRVSVVSGTHTHVQTADERILPGGTAYITDLGMTGTLDGVIGMDPKICLDRARNQVLYRMEVAASGDRTSVQGIIAEIDSETGKAVSVKRISA